MRSGTYAGRSNPSTSIQRFNYTFHVSGVTIAYVRFYLRIATLPGSLNSIAFISGDDTLAEIQLNASGTLELWDNFNGVQIGSDSSALSVNTWYRIEVKVDVTTLSATALEAKIDGTAFASGTANYTGLSGAYGLRLGGISNGTYDIYFDDIAVNDNSGSFQNSYPGAGEIIHLLPNAIGDNSAWTPTSGDNYTNVDEVTPDDATTIVSATGVGGEIDDYNLAATPAAMDSDDVINYVGVGVRFSVSGASSGVELRLKASSGGTTDDTTIISSDTATTYFTNDDLAPKNYLAFGNDSNYEQPGGASAWTKATLDTAQIGITNLSGGGATVNVSTIWLLVDHTPAVAGGNDLSQVILRNESLRLLKVGK